MGASAGHDHEKVQHSRIALSLISVALSIGFIPGLQNWGNVSARKSASETYENPGGFRPPTCSRIPSAEGGMHYQCFMIDLAIGWSLSHYQFSSKSIASL